MNARKILFALCYGAFCCISAVPQASGSSSADQKFLDRAAQTDMMEAHLGRMAEGQAGAQVVKNYGHMLVVDHTNDYQQLSVAAAKAGARVPKGLDARSNKRIAPFEKLKGSAFDHRFIREMIVGHTKAIAEYRDEVADGKIERLKAYAKRALPTLEKHLHDAEKLEKAKK